MNKIRAALRGLLVFPMALLFILPGLFLSFFSKNWLPLALRMRRYWANISLAILGVQLEKKGDLPVGGPFIFVGNHRSYIDPIVALKDVEALPVAKAEVSSWPIIGYCAKATGILWVKRESQNSRANTVKAMEQLLKDGYSVLVYPEGTTHIEPVTRDFQRGAFRLAASLGVAVVPMAIEYRDKGDAWVGNDTFIPHFVRCFGKRRTFVKMAYGPATKGEDANQLMEDVKAWIDSRLVEFAK
jgi:1-acyl-sn-glycerol-3-phosphate acyltransferase